jgi:hypothetical protein
MRAFSAAALLEIWEDGQWQGAIERALTLLTAAHPETSAEALADLSIGRRDCDLLALREQTFGSRVLSVTPCPRCDEAVELSFNAADVRVAPPSETCSIASVAVDGYNVRVRLPNSLDLATIGAEQDVSSGRLRLVERCLITADLAGQPVSADRLPSRVIDAVEERMAQADPQADVRLAICCPSCGHQWQGVFDIVSFFWAEIEAWAARILREVHILASAYGWNESEILALSPTRRHAYLEKLGE